MIEALQKALLRDPNPRLDKVTATSHAYVVAMQSGRFADAYAALKTIAAGQGRALCRARAALLLPDFFVFTGMDPDDSMADAMAALLALVRESEEQIAGAAAQAYLELSDESPEELAKKLAPGLAVLAQRAEFDSRAAAALLKIDGPETAKRWLAEIAAGNDSTVDLTVLAQVIGADPSADCVDPLATVIAGLITDFGEREPDFGTAGDESVPDIDTIRIGTLLKLLARIDRPRADTCLASAGAKLKPVLGRLL